MLVWTAGARLAGYADVIAQRAPISKAFLGALLLGVATSLPELATTITTAAIGNAELVAGNLIGGVALQMAILAVVDLVAVKGAPTHSRRSRSSSSRESCSRCCAISIGGIGLPTTLLMAGYPLTIWISKHENDVPRWRATNAPELPQQEPANDGTAEISHARLYSMVALAAAIILGAGWALALTGDALAEQTGLGSTLVGMALVAASTSLPELSTSLGAVRLGNHQMAVSNIPGTNCREVGLFFVADVFDRGGPILAETNRATLFAAASGVLVTCIFLAGLLERRDRTVRMGVDSRFVLVAHGAAVGGVYYLR